MFNDCKQMQYKTIALYITKLRNLAATCDFAELRDDLIHNRLVIGIKRFTQTRTYFTRTNLTLMVMPCKQISIFASNQVMTNVDAGHYQMQQSNIIRWKSNPN